MSDLYAACGLTPSADVVWHYGKPYRVTDATGATIPVGRMVYRGSEPVPYIFEGIADADHVYVWDGARGERVPYGAVGLTVTPINPDLIVYGWHPDTELVGFDEDDIDIVPGECLFW